VDRCETGEENVRCFLEMILRLAESQQPSYWHVLRHVKFGGAGGSAGQSAFQSCELAALFAALSESRRGKKQMHGGLNGAGERCP
jgi:hypothetical protein